MLGRLCLAYLAGCDADGVTLLLPLLRRERLDVERGADGGVENGAQVQETPGLLGEDIDLSDNSSHF